MPSKKSFSAVIKHEVDEKGHQAEKEEGHGDLKGHPAIKEIAKKHNISIDKVISQVKKGYSLEKEHTNNIDMAVDIAIQHVDEIPDYYDRLINMEKQAKKDMKEDWSEKYKRSIDCNNPKGFSQRAHCQGKKKKEVKEDLGDWFGKGAKGGVGGGGWDRYNTKGERIGKCAREPGEPKPKCLSKEKAAKMSKSEIASAVRRKREKDPVADRSGKGGKPIMSSNKIKENHIAVAMGKELDDEGSMVMSQLDQIEMAITKLRSIVKDPQMQLPAWVQSKITMATDYIDTAADYMSSKNEQAQPEYEKFDRRVNAAMSAKTPDLKVKLLKLAGQAYPSSQVKTAEEFMEACWQGYKQVGMKKKGKKMVPNCVPEEVEIDEMIALAAPIVRGVAAVSRIGQGVAKAGQAIKTGAQAVKTGAQAVKTGVKAAASDVKDGAKLAGEIKKQPLASKKLQEPEWKKGLKKAGETAKSAVKTTVGGFSSMYEPREEYIMEKNVPTNPSLWSRAKAQARAKFDVYPSAYANGWAAKWYKSKGGGWKTSTKESYDARQLLSFSDFRQINNDSFSNEEETVNEVAAWQRKEGKNKEGGLNEKGRKSYEREHPGSDLKAPSKKVGNPRRASFCARMSGMKKKLTSKKTANDPNSRINKSLRAWNC